MHTHTPVLSRSSPCLLFSSPIMWPSFCIVTADETFGVTCLFRFDFLHTTFEQLPLNTRFTNTSLKGTNMCHTDWMILNDWMIIYACKVRLHHWIRINFFFNFSNQLILLISILNQEIIICTGDDYELYNMYCFVWGGGGLPIYLQEITLTVLTSWILFTILVHKHCESFFCSLF